MKSAQQKYFPQRGVGAIYIVLAIAAVILIGYLILTQKDSQKTNPENATTNNNSAQSILEKVETDSYAFYYPQGYLKSKEKVGRDNVLYYTPPNNPYEEDGLGVILNIEPLLQRNDAPTTEFCEEVARFSYQGETIIEAKPVSYVNSHGCEMLTTSTLETADVTDKVIRHEKHLWYKEKDDFSVVSAKAIYFNSMPEEDRNNMDLAVEQFLLK